MICSLDFFFSVVRLFFGCVSSICEPICSLFNVLSYRLISFATLILPLLLKLKSMSAYFFFYACIFLYFKPVKIFFLFICNDFFGLDKYKAI